MPEAESASNPPGIALKRGRPVATSYCIEAWDAWCRARLLRDWLRAVMRGFWGGT